MKTSQREFQLLGLVLGGVALLSGCSKHEKPNFIYMPDMVYSQAYKAQKGQLEGEDDQGQQVLRVRTPVEGTIPRDYHPYPYAATLEDGDRAGKALTNPIFPNRAAYLRGQDRFNTYCIVCHGPNGEGDGHIVPKFPRPPTLQSDKVRNWTDARIFHVITRGQNLMPSYASQIQEEDRWKIILYVRALQRSKHPTPEDIKKYEAEIAAEDAAVTGQAPQAKPVNQPAGTP